MSEAPSPQLPATCPSCGAVVRQSVPWCLQCYASLRPEPDPEPEPEPDPEPEPAPVDGLTAAPGAAPRGDVEAIAERMLADLRASEPRSSGWLSRLPSSRGARAGAVAGLIGALVLVLVLVLTVLGHLL